VSLLSAERHDVVRTLGWVRTGTDLLLRRLDTVPGADLVLPSKLPGWERRHVVAHLARNAEALGRLFDWARTGTVTPMYADAEQRAAEIETSAGHSATQLRRELIDTAAALETNAAGLDDPAWAATVRSARGRDIPAAEVPWMRAREVWLHGVDLDVGIEPRDLPLDFSLMLIDDLVQYLSALPDVAPFRLVVGGQEWAISGGEGPHVTGAPRDVAAWLTGRSSGEDLRADALPVLPAWI
jgi:maleylpyruvate isomerase